MEQEIKYMKLRTFNAKRAELFGYKLTNTDKMIMMRSDDTHTELQHTDRYGYVSFSATMADDANCCRYKLNTYSHMEFWDTVFIPCTAEQERTIIDAELTMTGMEYNDLMRFLDTAEPNDLIYGEESHKYDLIGLLSFATPWEIIKYDPKKKWCTRAVYCALLEVYIDLLSISAPFKELHTYDLTPDLGDMLARNYFRKGRIAR